LILKNIGFPVLKSLVEPASRGRSNGIAPFFLAEADICLTADIFPLKYLAMKRRYEVLYGKDFLAGLNVNKK
jgi:hypothetical protein